MTVETKKYKLIEQITALEDEDLLNQIVLLIQGTNEIDPQLKGLVKPLRETLDLQQLKEEQGYQGINKDEIDTIIEAVDFQEPVTELLESI